jgi:hypothetical protein
MREMTALRASFRDTKARRTLERAGKAGAF